MKPTIQAFFDECTNTISYVVFDELQGHCAVIDSVLNYNAKSGKISTTSADYIIKFIQEHQLTLDWILETHVHADHLSASQYIKKIVGGKIAISKHITKVQKIFKHVFNFGKEFSQDGSQFDYLFDDEEIFNIGRISGQTLFIGGGHTPADIAYKIADCVFVGDTIFMPDVGTARCDFVGGDAGKLYDGIQKILALPDETKLFMCHDYPQNRDVQWEVSVLEQKIKNIHVNNTINKQKFIALRQEKDNNLEVPALIYPAIQVNVCAGKLPEPEDNQIRYLKMPLNI